MDGQMPVKHCDNLFFASWTLLRTWNILLAITYDSGRTAFRFWIKFIGIVKEKEQLGS